MNKILKQIEDKLSSIEDYKNPTKLICKEINDLRKSYDGNYVDDCFCARSSRSVFINDIKIWYNSL